MTIAKRFVPMIVAALFFTGCSQEQPHALTSQSVHGELESKITHKEVKVEISVQPGSVASFDELILHMENDGPSTLAFGTSYSLEKREQGVWFEVPFDPAVSFAEMALVLQPKKTFEQKINAKNFAYSFAKGEYRIVKSVYANGQEIILAAPFKVE